MESMLEELFDTVFNPAQKRHDPTFPHDLAVRCVKLLQEEFVI